MTARLGVQVGQYSDPGRKEKNQDFHGVYIPDEPLLGLKGIAVAIADGISSSEVSQVASESAVTGFFADYYCTSEAWSVKTSAQRVLIAINSWLHSQTRRSQYRYEKDKGYVCTFSALVIKSTTAYIFHAGDARIYRLQGNALEQLTNDHRLRISEDVSYLSRALGASEQLEIDYRALPVEVGSTFILATDGVYEYLSEQSISRSIQRHDDNFDAAAREIVARAYANGSADNLTVQIVRVVSLPQQSANEIYRNLTELPFPPALEPRMRLDGYRIVREVHASSRSHVYLAQDEQSGAQVILKAPSIDLRADAAYLERFMLEEWIARRINSAHVLKACLSPRARRFLYVVTEFIDGQTLAQWMIDHPKPDIESVRTIIEQIAKGLRAFHKLEMLHQDLRPANIMIDSTQTVKIIDFGSTRVAGLGEIASPLPQLPVLGTQQYSAPEYFLGEYGSTRSDLFSLGMITYQMLSGRLPYGTEVAQIRTRAGLRKLNYISVLDENREIPAWVDDAIRKAVHPNPEKRYEELSEFIHDLRYPNSDFLNKSRPPLLERNPLAFWQGVSFILALIIIALLVRDGI